MDKAYETCSAAGAAPFGQVHESVHSDLQYVSLEKDERIYGGWYRQLPDGRMELLALANMHRERRTEATPLEQARGMLEDFIRATRPSGRPDVALNAAKAVGDEVSGWGSQTLGKLLYADATKPRVSENDWLELVRLIAARDQLALDQLFQRTHRIVFTLIMRLIGDREIAEQLTLDVYHDVWQQASRADLAGGSVLAWLMNQARLRTIEHLETNRAKTTRSSELNGEGASLCRALSVLSADERQLIESAYFSERSYRDLAAELQQPDEDVKRRLQQILEKVREQLLIGPERP